MGRPREVITKGRLLSKIKVVAGRLKTPCWEWQGAKCSGKYAYGELQEGGAEKPRRHRAHRISFQLFKGPIPPGMDVLHRCDNPPCIRPGHLFAGTREQNCRDCAKKDRHARGMRSGAAKLTDRKVRTIRKSHESAGVLAKRYRVHRQTIIHVRNRRTWKHL